MVLAEAELFQILYPLSCRHFSIDPLFYQLHRAKAFVVLQHLQDKLNSKNGQILPMTCHTLSTLSRELS